ncbi:MAG: glycosyltransferase family 1 protein [Candidatus Angelobacter sp.]
MNNRQLHIGWDNSSARRSRTGTGVYASQLIWELSESPDVTLEVLNGWDMAQEGHGIFARAARSVSRLAWNHWYLPHIIQKRRFDVFHGPAFITPLPCPCPSVVTIHDVSFRLFPGYFERRWLLYVTSMLPRLLRSVSAVITVSHHAKSDLLSFYDVPSAKVHVVHNGIDHSRFNPGVQLDAAWASSVGLRSGYILHVGELSDRKNLLTLLRAIDLLRAKGTWGQRQLVLAGPETPGMTGADEIRETIRRLHLSDIVVSLGRIDHDLLPGLYRCASLFVMPSLYEGFGLPILESMACGIPVVASNTSSLPEVAGDAAIFVPPKDEHALADAIEQVLDNPRLAAELRAKGLVRAKQFNWQRTAEKTVEVYRSVAK